jgi:hypothetical protein
MTPASTFRQTGAGRQVSQVPSRLLQGALIMTVSKNTDSVWVRGYHDSAECNIFSGKLI